MSGICTRKRWIAMKGKTKKLPSLKNDAEAEQFVASADLSEFDLSGFKPMRFEFEPKTAALNMRLPHTIDNRNSPLNQPELSI